MKLLILILLFISCKVEEPVIPPVVSDECTHESCNGDNPEDENPILEVEDEENPYYYNNSLYLKKFTFWGYNFVSQNKIGKNSNVLFRSTNTQQKAIGSQYMTIYAMILFKNGEQLKIQYYNTNNELVVTYFRDWVIHDDLEFHIDGYRFGSFGWHSRINPTLKTQDENDNGVQRYTHTTEQYIGTNCHKVIFNLFDQECVDKYLITDVYSTYYYDN